jgi:hypothetical protein
MIIHDIKKGKRDHITIPQEQQKVSAPLDVSVKRHEVRDIVRGKNKQIDIAQEPLRKQIGLSHVKNNIETKQAFFTPVKRFVRDRFSLFSIPSFSVFMGMGVVVFILLFFLLPLARTVTVSDTIKASAKNGFSALFTASHSLESMDMSHAVTAIGQAQKDFEDARQELTKLSNFSRFLHAEGTDVSLFYTLLEVGDHFSSGGGKYVTIFQKITTLLHDLTTQSIEKNKATYHSLTDVLVPLYEDFKAGTADIQQGYDLFQTVPMNVFPREMQSSFLLLSTKLKSVLALAHTAEQEAPLFLNMIGSDYPRRYLILLQNKDEMRPTGGFIGSLIFVTFNDGWMTDLLFKDVYDFDGQLKEKIPAPRGLVPITPTMALRDSNYSPDFFVSGQDVADFLNKEGGPTVDGVIAINQGLIEDLLSLTGPIAVPGVKTPFDQDNFSLLLSYLVESKINPDHPKDILGKFAPLFLDQIKSVDPMALMDIVLSHIEQNDIAFYSPWQHMEEAFARFGLAGRVANVDNKSDYLLIADTSVSGNKSDRYITQQATHETYVSDGGKIIDRLTFEKKHTFDAQAEKTLDAVVTKAGFSPLSDAMKLLLGKGENVSFVRVYVPKGSTLLDSIGIPKEEVTTEEELNKTVFSFFLRVYPENSRKVILSYSLPFSLHISPVDMYKVLIQKQIGGLPMTVTKSLFVDNTLDVKDQYPPDGKKEFHYEKTEPLQNQIFMSALIGQGK